MTHLIGLYRRTAKNAMVTEHYEKLGFTPLDEQEAADRRFLLDLGACAGPNVPIRVASKA